MNPADEIVAIVDEHNNVIGSAPRREMRGGKLRHRSTYILVFNSQGDLFVQKRTMTKDIYPGYHDPCTGGVVLHGESYKLSAMTRARRRIGRPRRPTHATLSISTMKTTSAACGDASFRASTMATWCCRRKKWKAANFYPSTPFGNRRNRTPIRRTAC